MDAKENGIYAWMSSVRASMANDPCRQLFEDQVQTHAFIFLDDYLEQILAGPKQGPIIELVKTPGRRKNVPRGTRAAVAAKVRSIASLSLDHDDPTKDTVPVNSFHKALLQARERSTQDGRKSPVDPFLLSNDPAHKSHERAKLVPVASIPEITVSNSGSRAGPVPSDDHLRNPPNGSLTPFSSSDQGAELSVIAEGNESPERSRVFPSTLTFDQEGLPRAVFQFRHEAGDPITEGSSSVNQIDDRPQEVPSSGARHSIPSSTSYHSISLNSPKEPAASEAHTGNHTEPLPLRSVTDTSMNAERNAFTAPLPIVPISNSNPIPDSILVPLNDSSPRSLARKGSIAGFPMLPAPSPLRKSMRVTQDLLMGPVPSTIAPAPVHLGKRTSWLMKAREAKAKEGTSSLPNTCVAAFPRVSTAVKRKSGEMLDVLPPGSDWDKDQRKVKVAKSTEVVLVPQNPTDPSQPTALCPVAAPMRADHLEPYAMGVDEQITRLDEEEGFIDLFKRTVEGLGARAGKSMGKSFGGAAAAALAEARAAAEAKVAERNKVNDVPSVSEAPRSECLSRQECLGTRARSDSLQAEQTGRRLSHSDLAPDSVRSIESEHPTKTFQAVVAGPRINSGDEGIPTTPPDSPPSKGSSSFVKPIGPVFNKPPPPVFVPPASRQISENAKDQPINHPSGLPGAITLGIPARLAFPSDGFPLVQGASQMSVHPSQSSIVSDPIFDNCDGVPTWVPSTQDTAYISDSQRCDTRPAITDNDDDDSWPLEEKLAADEPGWRPFNFSNVDKEDTWSSLPTESQGPAESPTTEKNGDAMPLSEDMDVEIEPNDAYVGQEQVVSDDERSIMEIGELEKQTTKSASRTSITSTASSSQSQAGFFSQATKLVNSMLGGGKKAKPELKSLQLAAVAAKKQQEEVDKKVQRLRDMEARRQVVIAKKAEEERTRLLEEEKKTREELERRKREREENTDRRPLRPPVSTKKADEDASKKRKLAPEVEKKPDGKKFVPLVKSAVTPTTKLAAHKGAKASAAALVSSAAYNATQNAPSAPSAKLIIPEAKPFKVVPPSLKGKTKSKLQEDDTNGKLPSTVVQSQMAARVKAQMQAAKSAPPEVPSESIELPDINSEYSDSEDEERVRTFDPPEWAQSPELRQALQMQSTVNPDDIFGAVRPLRMEEMFRTRQSRFRARTSSANWSGTDRLTVEEIHEYERRMGFQQALGS